MTSKTIHYWHFTFVCTMPHVQQHARKCSHGLSPPNHQTATLRTPLRSSE
jgi:hypothetical protein